MGEVSITLGGRTFKLGCDDGEEAHLLVLAEHLGKHVENLRVSLGKTGEDQLFLMAGLLVCDELWDSRNELNELDNKIKSQAQPPATKSAQEPLKDPIIQVEQPAQTKASGQELTAPIPAKRPAAAPVRVPCLDPLAAPLCAQRPKTLTKQT